MSSAKLTAEDIGHLLHNDETFVNSKRYGYSIDAVMERYPDGAPNNVIGQLLNLDKDDIDARYSTIVAQLRAIMGVEATDEELRDTALPPEES
jgi:hypothetical protein